MAKPLIIISEDEDINALSDTIKRTGITLNTKLEELEQKARKLEKEHQDVAQEQWLQMERHLINKGILEEREDNEDHPVLQIKDGVLYLSSVEEQMEEQMEDMPEFIKHIMAKRSS